MLHKQAPYTEVVAVLDTVEAAVDVIVEEAETD
jgi:hypothetical protein